MFYPRTKKYGLRVLTQAQLPTAEDMSNLNQLHQSLVYLEKKIWMLKLGVIT